MPGVYRRAWLARPRRKVVSTHAAGHVVVRRRSAGWLRWSGWRVWLRRHKTHATGTSALAATGPGVEHTLPDAWLHQTLPVGRLHHTLPDSRLHHTIPVEDARV